MKVDIIRFLDKYLGAPACLLLSLFKGKKEKINNRSLKKILLIKIWGIGSIINSTPTIATLKSKYPQSKIYLLTMNHNQGLYENNKEINKIFSLDLKNIFTAFHDILNVIMKLRKEKIDALIDLEISSNATALISNLINAKYSISYSTGKTKDKLYDCLVHYDKKCHIVEIFGETLRPLGIRKLCPRYILPAISKKDKVRVEELLSESGLDEYVTLNVNASPTAFERRLSLDKFEEIARYLKKKGKKVVLIGSVFEKEYVDTLISRTSDLNGIYSFAGKTNLPQLSYLIRRSELLITNDSGPLHLGVVAGIKTISFFGPETPSKYGPRGKNHIVIYHKTVCSPCMEVFNSKKINCEHNIKCLKGIKIQEIKNAIDRQLK